MKIFKFLSAFAAFVASTGISTHVLDLTTGLPGPGMKIDVFYQVDQGYGVGPDWTPIRSLITNSDGRTDEPVVSTEEIEMINRATDNFYKIVFYTDEYYKDVDTFFPRPEMVFRVKKEQIGEHFHVPILCTPYSYSTYRGS